jgi:uncharacterized protein YecT (DUF1311 family)
MLNCDAKRVALLVCLALPIQPSAAHSEEKPSPSQLTSRGTIAWQGSEDYRTALESCYPGKAGEMPHGPLFLTCLKQLVRNSSASLDAVYAGTVGYLKPTPRRMERLRQSQRLWLQFQESNCAFARAVSARERVEEAYLDCILRSTTDRSAELRNLVGD